MADVTKNILTIDRPIGGVPFGNLTVLPFKLSFDAGVLADSDKATAVVHTERLILGELPKGMTLLTAIIKSTAGIGAATSTLDVGFKYKTTETGAIGDFFADAQANSAAISVFGNGTDAPVTLTDDAYLTATVNTAAFEGTGDLMIWVLGICDQI